MKSATMRGTGLGTISYESERGVEAPESQVVRYCCTEGHQSIIPFSVEAEDIPLTWTCRCGREAEAVNHVTAMVSPNTAGEKTQRSHWDMLLERRSITDLEDLLKERLELLHMNQAEQQLLSA